LPNPTGAGESAGPGTPMLSRGGRPGLDNSPGSPVSEPPGFKLPGVSGLSPLVGGVPCAGRRRPRRG